MRSNMTRDVRNNWRMESVIEHKGRTVKVLTVKRSNGCLATTCNVGKTDGNFFTFTVFQDFSTTLMNSTPKRITERVVETQHDEVMAKKPELLEAIDAFYAKLDA